MLERTRHELGSHETADVGDVRHQIGAHAVGDLPEASIVEVSRVPTGATEKHVRLEFEHGRGNCVHINQTSLLVDVVRL